MASTLMITDGRNVASLPLNNAAFEFDPRPELARILREVADKIESGANGGTMRDVNGNRIGDWVFDFDDAEEE